MDENPPPEKAKAPIDWAKWLLVASSVAGAIAAVIRTLKGV